MLRTLAQRGGRRVFFGWAVRSGREEGGDAGPIEGFPHGDGAEAALGRGERLARERQILGNQLGPIRLEAAAEVDHREQLRDVAG